MAPKIWDPFQDLISVEERINRMFSGSLYPGRSKMHVTSDTWEHVVDVSETPDSVIVKAELPGINREEVSLAIEKQKIITLKGVRKREKQSSGKQFHRIERFYGAFERSFILPTQVDPQKVNANLSDGVLKVVLPKKTRREALTIPIEFEEESS